MFCPETVADPWAGGETTASVDRLGVEPAKSSFCSTWMVTDLLWGTNAPSLTAFIGPGAAVVGTGVVDGATVVAGTVVGEAVVGGGRVVGTGAIGVVSAGDAGATVVAAGSGAGAVVASVAGTVVGAPPADTVSSEVVGTISVAATAGTVWAGSTTAPITSVVLVTGPLNSSTCGAASRRLRWRRRWRCRTDGGGQADRTRSDETCGRHGDGSDRCANQVRELRQPAERPDDAAHLAE